MLITRLDSCQSGLKYRRAQQPPSMCCVQIDNLIRGGNSGCSNIHIACHISNIIDLEQFLFAVFKTSTDKLADSWQTNQETDRETDVNSKGQTD